MVFRQLGTRLFLAFLTVVAIGTGTFVLTFRLLAPEVFGRRMEGVEGAGSPGPGGGYGRIIAETFEQSVDTALVISIIVGAVAAFIVAAFVTRRMVAPFQQIGEAARALAAGDYQHRADEPEVEELANLARDVNSLAEALHETELQRARLMSDVAHELRTPLTSIDGYAEGVVDGVFTEHEMVDAVTGETRRLRKLVDDLSLLSRTSEGSLRFEMEPVDLNVVLVACEERLRPQFEAAGVTLDVVTADECRTKGDFDRLTQAVTNILGNALLHTGSDGTVTMRSAASGDLVTVTITDDGEGIDPDDLPRLFDRFFRGSGSARPGTGIGLSVAHGVVVAHGGVITAESAGLGHGASFKISLPSAGV